MATKKRVGKNMRRTRGRKQRGGFEWSSLKSLFWGSNPPENKTDQATVAPTVTSDTKPAPTETDPTQPVPTTDPTKGGKRRKKRGTKSK